MNPIVTKDVYKIVTNIIIHQLEQGTVPWKQPWRNAGLPCNLITRRPYRGINHVLLRALNYPINDFLTFHQVQELGGKVKKGEKAHLVIYWTWFEPSKHQGIDEIQPKRTPLLRYYFVFNVAQCINLPDGCAPIPAQQDEIEACEQIIAKMPLIPELRHNEPEAYYSVYFDYINMPPKRTFESSHEYYATLFHELVHSTGHESRLNRKELVEMPKFGSNMYSLEELTAEIGSCYLTSYAGIAPPELTNSVAYIKGWLAKLKSDKRFIVRASAHAQKATDFILNIKHEENEAINHVEDTTL